MHARILLLALALAPAVFAQVGFSGPGRYEISNIESAKPMALDLNDRTTVVQISTRGAQNVIWEIQPAPDGFFFIRNALSGGALEASPRNSTPVAVRPFNGGPAQQWRFEADRNGPVMIVSRIGKALDIPDGDRRDGVRINTYDPNGEGNQRFDLRPVSGGAVQPPFGQRPFGRDRVPPGRQMDRTVRCSSEDGRRTTCAVDTSGGVRFLRSFGGSFCREGESWGFDRRGIWVDRGCRGEFGLGGGRMETPASSYTVTCASEGGRNYCRADTSGGVRMVRPLGGNCREGQTWGFDRAGIWVDRGCRAEFEVLRR